MICFSVSRNGDHRCIAGLPDGVVSAGLMWASHADGSGRYGLEYSVTGTYGGDDGVTSVEWVREALAVGDSVTFSVVTAAEADAASPSPPVDKEDAAAFDFVGAQLEHIKLRKRLAALEERWGSKVADG
jgi:hypothetical protein